MKKNHIFLGLMIFTPLVLFGSEERIEQTAPAASQNAADAQAQQQTEKRVVFTNAHNSPYTIYLEYCLRNDNQSGAAPSIQQPVRWIRRVLVPGEVLYIEEAIDELLWLRDNEVNRLPLPNFQSGRISFGANGQFRTHGVSSWQVPLRVRGTNELKKFFPALWPQVPTSCTDIFTSVSDFINPLTGQTASVSDGGPHFHCPEVQQKISEFGLNARQASCRILALKDNPTAEEIDHAFANKLKDVSQAFRAISGVIYTKDAVDRVVIQTLCDAKNVLDVFKQERSRCQPKGLANEAMQEAVCINKTNQTVYIAPYYVNAGGDAVRIPDVNTVSIPPYCDALVNVLQLTASAGCVTEYFVAPSPHELAESLSVAECEQYDHSSFSFSSVFSNAYYIIKEKETDRLTIMPLIQYGTSYCRTFPNDPQQFMGKYDCPANGTVQKFADSLPEASYLQERMPRVKASFESFLHAEGVLPEGTSIESGHLPQIGIAFTGGGYRAMIKSAAFCAAAEEMQLAEVAGELAYSVHDYDDDENEEAYDDEPCCLASYDKKLKKSDKVSLIDVTAYMSGLSGSTWALASFLDAKMHNENSLTFREFGKKLKSRVVFNNATFPPTVRDIAFYAHIIRGKSGYNMPALDFIGNSYAYHLAKRLLWGDEDYRHYQHLSDLKDTVDATIPFPFLTAITMDGEDHNEPTWLEFSPFHVGAHRGGGYWIDSRFFGREFFNGETTSKGMEEYLGYIMAICGSAYATNLTGISDHVPIAGYLPKPESGESVLATRMTQPSGYNFTVGLERPMGCTQSDPQGQHVIGYIDGAHDQVTVGGSKKRHNFATIPLLARGLDVIIMCDGVRGLSTAHLQTAKSRADYFGFPFPQYRPEGIGSMQDVFDNMRENRATLWVDQKNLDAPVIVYLAVMKDDSYDPDYDPSEDPSTHTLNFSYTSQQYDKLYGLAKHVFKKAEPVIKQALQIAYERKVAQSCMTPEERAGQADQQDQQLDDEYSLIPQSAGSILEAYPELVPSQMLGQAAESVSSVPPAEARPLAAEEICDWPDDEGVLFGADGAHTPEQVRADVDADDDDFTLL